MQQRSTLSTTERIFMAAIAITGWFAIVLQFIIIIGNASPGILGTAKSIVTFFSFFTILTNIIVAIACTVPLIAPSSKAGFFFSRATVQSAITVYIVIVGIVYSLVLRKLWNPQGSQLLADRLLHDVIPVLYFLFWLLFVPKGVLQWKNSLAWLTYPLVYLVYALLRGAITGLYPYPFIDVNQIGYPKLVINVLVLMVAFLGLSILFISINKLMARFTATGTTIN